MSSQLRNETIPASGRMELGPGNFFFLFSTTLNINVQFNKSGTYYGAEGVGGGYLKKSIDSFRSVVINGTPGTVLSYFFGQEEVREDDTDYRASIATISGTVTTSAAALSTFATAVKATVNTATSVDIAADATRKAITLTNESDSPNSFWVRDQTATSDAGYELQPGQSVRIANTAALRIRNNGAGNCDYTIIVET